MAIGSNANIRGIVMFGIFVFLAAGLFFIPEIINFQNESTGNKSENDNVNTLSTKENKDNSGLADLNDNTDLEKPIEGQDKSKVKTVEKPNLDNKSSSNINSNNSSNDTKNPLNKVINKLDSGLYDIPKSEQDVIEASADPETRKRLIERNNISKILDQDLLTWEILKKPEIIEPVKRTINESRNLMAVIDKNKTFSRLALQNFINTLTFFVSEEVRNFTPYEVLKMLGDSDAEVTQKFIEEGINRTEFNIWKAISLGPLVASSGLERKKQKYTPPFYADIVLTSVDINEKIVQDNKLNIFQWTVNVEGFVLGKDAIDLQIYNRGIIYKVIGLGQADNFDRKRFNFTATDVPTGVFIFRAIDQSNGYMEKTYSFVRGARKYPKSKDGVYQIPKYAISNNSQNLDRKIDFLFLFGSPRGDTDSLGYTSDSNNTFNEGSGKVQEF